MPTVGALIAIISTAEPDISDLSPVVQTVGQYAVLNWPDLERRSRALQQGAAVFAGARVQALGYMVESDRPIRAGEPVRDFVLLPDAGNLLHPAHRFGDQMIAVHLAAGMQIQFTPRRLVWARGVLRASSGNPGGDKPLYALEEATATPANETDLKRYFR